MNKIYIKDAILVDNSNISVFNGLCLIKVKHKNGFITIYSDKEIPSNWFVEVAKIPIFIATLQKKK